MECVEGLSSSCSSHLCSLDLILLHLLRVIQVTEELLHAAFIPYGNIQEVQIPRDFKENTNRGFGFVQFYSEEDAAAAMDNMDGSELEVSERRSWLSS